MTSDEHSEGRLDCQIAGRLKSENAPTFCFYVQIPLKSIAAYDAIETIFLNGNPLSRVSLVK